MTTKEIVIEKIQNGIQYKNHPIYGIVKVEAKGKEVELMIGVKLSHLRDVPFIAFVPLNEITEKDFVGKTEIF